MQYYSSCNIADWDLFDVKRLSIYLILCFSTGICPGVRTRGQIQLIWWRRAQHLISLVLFVFKIMLPYRSKKVTLKTKKAKCLKIIICQNIYWLPTFLAIKYLFKRLCTSCKYYARMHYKISGREFFFVENIPTPIINLYQVLKVLKTEI